MKTIRQQTQLEFTDNRSLSEKAYLLIRERILRGHLRIGDALSRRRLAEELGVSLLPISEALQRLEHDGLLESRPRAGTRVRVPTENDIRERYVIREALESQAARLFAERATPKQREELRRMAEHLDVLFNRLEKGEADPEFQFTVHSYHSELHMLIAEHSGCGLLREMIEKNQVLILNWLYDVSAERRALPPRFHRDLIETLATAAPLQADKAMRDHVRYGLEDTVRRMQIEPAVEWRLHRSTG